MRAIKDIQSFLQNPATILLRSHREGKVNRTALIGRSKTEKVTLFVKSKRVCVDCKNVCIPVFDGGPYGSRLSSRPRRVAIYENILDPEQNEALRNTQILARSLGVQLEVKDLGRMNVFEKFVLLISRNSFVEPPSLSLPGKTISSFGTRQKR
jgi:hypothetical protein